KQYPLKFSQFVVVVKQSLPRKLRFKRGKLSPCLTSWLFRCIHLEPVVSVRAKSNSVIAFSDIHETVLTEHLGDIRILERRQVKRNGLGELREVCHCDQALIFPGAGIAKDLGIARVDELNISPTEQVKSPPHGDHVFHPPKQR